MTNHTLARLAAFLESGIKRFTNYFVLGDDIIIYNRAIAKRYIAIVQRLGANINDDTIYSNCDFYCEFAKRTFRNGVEISPLALVL